MEEHYSCTKTQTLFPASAHRKDEPIGDICSPPETVLFRLVGSLATDEEGFIQGLDHFVVQLVTGVQVIHAGHQLVEPMAQNQFAAR